MEAGRLSTCNRKVSFGVNFKCVRSRVVDLFVTCDNGRRQHHHREVLYPSCQGRTCIVLCLVVVFVLKLTDSTAVTNRCCMQTVSVDESSHTKLHLNNAERRNPDFMFICLHASCSVASFCVPCLSIASSVFRVCFVSHVLLEFTELSSG
jgi:hypothetical protein